MIFNSFDIRSELLSRNYSNFESYDILNVFATLPRCSNRVFFLDQEAPQSPFLFSRPQEVGLVITGPCKGSGRNWIVATDAYLYALAAKMVPADPLVMVLDQDRHLAQVDGAAVPYFAPDLATYVHEVGVPHRFVETFYVEGHSAHAGQPIFWREPQFVCCLSFDTKEHHAIARLCL
jgi:hypothetical protein